ncbi:hypothetical protein Y032_0029g1877 [Ancylostoma ceylanicum]|uniref:Uncharacterized protein n=1 Tax=Ancylostoma ceylanicum TaxID=53326 RepID=A0A016US90_9BILA|nr:hypothetical protein Y032_0029g1877 [Ancylostoma ceylanicum]
MKDSHSTVVALYRSGKRPLQIVKELKTTGVNQDQGNNCRELFGKGQGNIQRWFQNNIPDFVFLMQCSARCLNLNPMNFSIWSIWS